MELNRKARKAKRFFERIVIIPTIRSVNINIALITPCTQLYLNQFATTSFNTTKYHPLPILSRDTDNSVKLLIQESGLKEYCTDLHAKVSQMWRIYAAEMC